MNKHKLVLLLDKLEEEKEKYKILKENCKEIRKKSKVYKFISNKISLLKEQDEKYYSLCKEITGDIPKKECLKEMKRRIKESREKEEL